MRAVVFVVTIMLMLMVSTGAIATVPSYINFQGTLTDSAGNPITGTRHMRFHIYDDSTGGTAIWSEQHDDVPINDGLFRVVLGSNYPLATAVFDGTTKWVTARIYPDGSELVPRQPLVTVPYSFRTSKSDSAYYATNAYFADYSDQANQALEANLATEAAHAVYADTADYSLVSAPDNDWTIDGSDVYHLVGDVGIGTTPMSGVRLHVAGGIMGTYLRAHNDFGLQFANDNGLVRMEIEDGGNVGIGTGSPTEKLDVNGTVKMTGFQLTGSRSAGDVLTSDASGVGTWQSVDEFTLPIDDSVSTYSPALRITNTVNSTGGTAIFGTHNYSGNYGYLASNSYGVYGRHSSSGNWGMIGGNSQAVYGNSSTGWAGYFVGDVYTNGDVGIGTTTPAERLDVAGTIETDGLKLTTGATDGYVLTSDASGVGSWQEVEEFTIPIDDSASTTGSLLRLTNTYPGTNGVTFHGKHDYSGNYGYVGSCNYGLYGKNGGSGNYGYIGDNNYAVYGINAATGNWGMIGGSLQAVFGHSASAWAGFFSGDLYSSGNVGIGTTTPSAQLDVVGTVEAEGLKLTTGAANNYVLTSDASGVGTWQPRGFSLPYSGSVVNTGAAFDITNTSSAVTATAIQGTNNFTGNFGYVGGDSCSVYGEHYSLGNHGCLGTMDYGAYGKHGSYDNYGALGSVFSGVYGYSANYYGGYFDGDLYVSDDVGIGTTPECQLHIYKASTDAKMKIESDYGAAQIELDGWSDDEQIIYFKEMGTTNALIGYSNSSGIFRIYESDRNTIVSSGGLVGIRNASPSQSLDVIGDVIIGGGNVEYDGNQEWLQVRAQNDDWYIGAQNETTAGATDFYIGTDHEDGKFHIQNNGYVGIGTTTPVERLHVNGCVRVDAMDGTTSGSQVRWYNNLLCYYSSSKKYKDDIQPLEDNFDKILDAQPVSFIDKLSGERNIGLIAEDMEGLGLEHLVVHRDGEPDGVKYELVSLYLLETIKELKATTEQLTQENQALQQRIATLEEAE